MGAFVFVYFCGDARKKVGAVSDAQRSTVGEFEAGFVVDLIDRYIGLVNLVHAGSYIDYSVLLADDNGQFSDWAG